MITIQRENYVDSMACVKCWKLLRDILFRMLLMDNVLPTCMGGCHSQIGSMS
jgi:hypothetical protein